MKIGYQKTVLNNRLRVISEKIDYVRSIAVGVWVDAGSRDEGRNENGTSHFIEHMLFKGTKNRTAHEISSSLESLGGILNAFSGRENTCYFAKITDEHLEPALDVLSDLILNPLFKPGDLNREKKVISEEIKDLNDTPSELIFDLFMSGLWGDHPLGRPILGKIENIQSLKRNQLINFMQSNYIGQRMVIAASGNLNHGKLLKLVEKKFRLKDSQRRRKPKVQPLKSFSQKMVVEKKTEQAHICLGFPGYPYKSIKRYQVLLLGNILGGGMSSRLFQTIREKLGLVYNINTFSDFFSDMGVFGVHLGTDKKQVTQAVEQVLKELNRIKRERLSKKELDGSKNQLKGHLIYSAENTSSRMNRLATLELYLNDYISLDETISLIDKVKAAEVVETANELLDENKLTAAILGPVDRRMVELINWGYI